MVCFQRFPALAILRNRLSASNVFCRCPAGTVASVELAASNVDCVGPEK